MEGLSGTTQESGLGCRSFLSGGHVPHGEEVGDVNDQNWDRVRWQVSVEKGLERACLI